jgi:hypothetical protein
MPASPIPLSPRIPIPPRPKLAIRQPIRERLHQQRRQDDPAEPREGEHGGEDAAGEVLGAEGGEVGPDVGGEGCADELEEPEEAEDGEFLPAFGKGAVFALGVDDVNPG